MNISAVIINYNGEKFLPGNLDSLGNQTKAFKQIIVVDNHSQDNSLKIIKQYKGIELIEMGYNSGYACACNTGISRCDSDLILVANSDTFFDLQFNARVADKCLQDKTIAMISPLILRFDAIHVDSAGQTRSLALYPREIGYNRELRKVNIQEGPVFSVCGAATVFRKSALEKLKIRDEYYDEDFFTFWEDFDLGWRANLLGLNVYFFPGAIAYHYRSGTMKKTRMSRISLSLGRSPDIKFHLVKNRYLTLIKNFRWSRFWWTLPFIFIKDLIWVGSLTLSSPQIIMKLILSFKTIRKAQEKRKLIKKYE
ncbi:MAG: glycosyltransferase family 2 protein [Candidatus Aminicenantes bacterium]|nr:glycosyltransferase family 2 protein [Candidatus Aminicenantes bacterium]